MHIDWAQTQVYNTIMAVATGVGLLLLVRFSNHLRKGERVNLQAWSIGFAVPGFILTLTGAHMTLTWPLSKIGFPFDDIIFGEPSLAFGVMLLAGSVALWQKSKAVSVESGKPVDQAKEQSSALVSHFAEMGRPVSYFAAAMGLALISIACAGIYYQLFAAPPQEPISGRFANYPMLEASFISALYALVGLGAILLPFSLARGGGNPAVMNIITVCWSITGVLFTLFGAMNYFTHIGLIINTM
ncbi:DUF981 domain-containing protein [Cohnella pontilimi]|uniref:DUF981 domain-containing protein n=1 Tax=Cohnella pontilimi TaxID=2564100 RepID=A0A4U0FC61_9BACL|nr:DUF981 domain-containing protein [Cohnella pontilimi]TJY42307.1 DUF981 domain-containing protein [Cohnella pontilimi]